MFRFKGYIFNTLFTIYDKITDPNKDADDKGTQERFQECFEEEYDEAVLPPIENMQANLYHPQEMIDRYVPFNESMMGYDNIGWPWFFKQPLSFRRNLLDIMPKLYRIRGTRVAYKLMFSWLGLSVDVVNVPPIGGSFDLDGFTFDMEGRTFDMDCPTCSEYDLIVTGPGDSLTADELEAIETIIAYNQPINARLRNLSYATEVGDFGDDFFIDTDGDFF